MKRDLRTILISLLLVSLFSMFALGQETSGSMEITVKDAAGAVVPNVSLTVASSGTTAGFRRTVTTDDSGYVRLLQVPPGGYTITAAAIAGFVEKKVDQIVVSLGKTSSVSLELSTTVETSVTVTGADVSPIDATDNKIQTTISAETAELLPKGNNFDSILKLSPSTRPEPRSGQFQIDGASGSENTFIIDGLEVTNVITGTLDANSNLPFAIVQEVQVKSSGFEAEYGGATGGVINVVTKGGGNDFHGEFGSSFRLSAWEPIAGPALRSNNGVPEYYPSRRDHYSEFNPKASLGGPILKNRLWFFASYGPQIFNRERTITYLAPSPSAGRTERYIFEQVREYNFARLDAQPFESLHLTGSYTYNPVTQEGPNPFPSFASAFSTTPSQPGTPSNSGAAYLNQTGGRQNAQSITGQGVYTMTSKLIFSGRIGHYFLNEKLGSYGGGDLTVPRVSCSTASLAPIPPSFGCSPGTNNGVAAIANVLFDATSRDVYEGDATYSFNGAGRHEIKGGYQYNGIANQVDLGTNDSITIRYGRPISNLVSGIPSTPGAIGAASMQTFRTRGDVSSSSHGIYFQDKWQPMNRLTLNLGVRTEQETVPSFATGLPGIKFDFRSKLAPRLGAAFDLSGNGKSVVKAFYGWFFDRFKYELPRGSFGGDEFHNLFFEIFPGDTVGNITRDVVFGTGAPIPTGACPLGVLTPVFGRVRCDRDNRVSSNSGGPLTEVGGIDPNIKPFRQSELTFSYEREMWKNYVFSARYTHKQVDAVVEDAGFPNSQSSEYYIIGNPGMGLHKEQSDFFGVLSPKPERKYDALEIRFDRRFANNFRFDANYTFSRLYGNYGGLASSDEEGRLSPNVNRYFDQPQAGFTVAGGPDNGRLPTDRPHVLKFFGAYSFDWSRIGWGKANSTDFLLFTTASSGSVITSFANINGIEQIILTKRGDQGRTPVFTQTDFALRHRLRFGRDRRYTLIAETDILNLFNEYNVTNMGLNPSGQGGNIINTINFSVENSAYNLITPAQRTACGTNQQCLLIAGYRTFQQTGSAAILAAAQSANGHNPFYNLPSSYQAKRQIRFGFRLIL